MLREAVGGFHAVARVAAAHRLDVVMDHQASHSREGESTNKRRCVWASFPSLFHEVCACWDADAQMLHSSPPAQIATLCKFVHIPTGPQAVAQLAADTKASVQSRREKSQPPRHSHLWTAPEPSPPLLLRQVPLALATIFGLAHKYGDTLRAGWGNIIECLLRLQRINLLADGLGSDPESGEGLSVGALSALLPLAAARQQRPC